MARWAGVELARHAERIARRVAEERPVTPSAEPERPLTPVNQVQATEILSALPRSRRLDPPILARRAPLPMGRPGGLLGRPAPEAEVG